MSDYAAGYTVYKRKDSPYWWIAYNSTEGRKFTSSRQRWDNPLGYKRALDVARKLSEDQRATVSSGDSGAWESWVPALLERKHGSPEKRRTLATELHRWRWVHAFLHERGLHHPAMITYQIGMQFLDWRQAHKTRGGKGGFNNALGELHLLSRLLREAVRAGYIQASPLERMGIKRRKPAEKREINDDEIAAIRKALAEREGHLPIRERWMTVSFEIAIRQGCRMMETEVPLSNVDEAAGTITFRQKGDRIFTTRLHDGLRPLLAELRAAGADRTCHMPTDKLASKYWHWFLKGRPERNQAAVAPGICFHCTRVTVITRMARAGVPIQKAMAYVGHADQTVHKIYQRLKAPDLSQCVEALGV